MLVKLKMANSVGGAQRSRWAGVAECDDGTTNKYFRSGTYDANQTEAASVIPTHRIAICVLVIESQGGSLRFIFFSHSRLVLSQRDDSDIKSLKQKIEDATPIQRCRTILSNIRYRCLNPTDRKYRWYGGKGILPNVTLEELVY